MAFFYISVFLSAFLLFLVEPLIGKTLLPWFGGSAAVWSTALLFFQVFLTGGYAYAAWLSRSNRRGLVHLILLVASLVVLLGLGFFWQSPITPAASASVIGGFPPILAIFIFLLASIGLPFILLASNSTLTQSWFHRLFPGQTPYHLYALSNASSLIALFLYPTLVEPNLALPAQGWIWSAAYLVFAGITMLWTSRLLRSPAAPVVEKLSLSPKLAAREIRLWLVLSACASVLLLSVTNYLTQQVAVVPFLWVLPLGIYLLTFVLAFSGERAYPRQVYIIGLLPVILLYDLAMANGGKLGIPLQVVIFGLVLFLGCMVCNGELFRLRPGFDRLPAFYLSISAGGALGALLVNLVAPVLFAGYWELPLGVLLFCSLFLWIGRGSKGPGFQGELFHTLRLAVLAIAVVITLARLVFFIGGDLTGSVLSKRNFYGVIRVRQASPPGTLDVSYQLINGTTIHGAQFQAPAERDIPTVYYGPQSGVGLALLNHPRQGSGLRVGALGLGVGTIAAYGQPGDTFRFYEINPEDIRLAEGEGGYFTYLKDSRAKIQVVSGDARLSLQQEAASGKAEPFDVLVVDVFTNDAIPVHLLDEQAFALYLGRLTPDGVLAVHITNAYLDLVPVVWSLADHFDLDRAIINDPGDGHFTSTSTWVLLSRDPQVLAVPEIAGRAEDMSGYVNRIRLWTDNYSNLFQLLKR